MLSKVATAEAILETVIVAIAATEEEATGLAQAVAVRELREAGSIAEVPAADTREVRKNAVQHGQGVGSFMNVPL